MTGVGEHGSRRRVAATGSTFGGAATAGACLLVLLLAAGPAAPARAEGPTGSVSGVVRLTGKAPKGDLLDLSSDPNCLEIAGRRVRREEVVVGRDGALANVFVRLEGDGLAAAAGPVPGTPVVVEQRGCIYYPRMAGARAGQTLRVINGDEIIHNVRSVSAAGSDFNIGQPYSGMEFDFELAAPEPMLELRCDMHPWMRSYIGVVDHSWFAVTSEDGRFTLADVAPGAYEVVFWHERYGVGRAVVEVVAGEDREAGFSYSAEAGG